MTSASPPSEPSATAKLWFWLVISTAPVASRRTGWLPPWWPNGSLTVARAERGGEQLVAEADAEHRHLAERARGWPRPRTPTAAGSPGPFERNTPSGSARQHLGGRGGRGHDLDVASPDEVAQDRALDAEVVGDDPAVGAVADDVYGSAHVTVATRSTPSVPGSAAAAALSVASSAVPNAPGIAPASRMWRVSRRVSMPAMPGTPWCAQERVEVAVAAPVADDGGRGRGR